MLWRVRDVLSGLLATRAGAALGYTFLIGTLVGFTAWTALRSATWVASRAPAFMRTSVDQRPTGDPRSGPVAQVKGRVVLTQDAFHEMIRTKEYWARRSSAPQRPARIEPHRFIDQRGIRPFGLGVPPGSFDGPDEQDRTPTYRTVCVRLCDGYFWPVSFSTRRDNFARDEAACQDSCRSPAKLYIYRNPGEEPKDMRTTDGEPYARLPTAGLYRTNYVAACTCKAQPWEKEAVERHRVYALEAASRKGDKSAVAELGAIRAKAEAERRLKLMLRRVISGSQLGAKAARSTRPISVTGLKLKPSATAPSPTPAPIQIEHRQVADEPAITIMRLGTSPDPFVERSRRGLPQSRWARGRQSIR